MYYQINEEAAKRAHDANSFRTFEEGRATRGYRQMVDGAKEIAEAQKAKVDPMHHDKIDGLLDTYARKLAANLNKRYEIDARVPSIMISGGSNFPVRKKEKQNAARDKNMEEYDYIKGLLDKIQSVGMGGISADDPDALDKLREKLADTEKRHDYNKKANAWWRKHKTMQGYADMKPEVATKIDKRMETAYSWVQSAGPCDLTGTNAEIKRLKVRIAALEKRDGTQFTGYKFDGGEVAHNAQLNRLQIFFEGKPDEAVRDRLKANGFKWAPTQSAWQRQFTPNAIRALNKLGFEPIAEGADEE